MNIYKNKKTAYKELDRYKASLWQGGCDGKFVASDKKEKSSKVDREFNQVVFIFVLNEQVVVNSAQLFLEEVGACLEH